MGVADNAEWLLCPVCGNKTRLKIRGDTELKNFPIYCSKCKQETLIELTNLQVIVIKEPDTLDAGKSGKSIEGRPAFKKMLSDIKNGLEIEYILVYKLSRFGRNAADILNSLEFVQSYGINLICIEEGIDSSQTSGKLLISVLSAVAEIERENIIEQTMNGRREKEAEAIRIISDKFGNSGIGA
jgi:DNA invertase Pin-like site-specific DNA recombinase